MKSSRTRQKQNMLSTRRLIRGLLALLLSSLISSVSAETAFVIGSYKSQEIASQIANEISQQLGCEVALQDTLVAGVPRYRLIISNADYNEDVAARVQSLGIKPWRVNRAADRNETRATEPQNRSFGTRWELADTFVNVADALALERRLAAQGLDVDGRTELISGQVVHQVWTRSRNSARPNTAPVVAAPPEKPRLQETGVTDDKSVKYPRDFNLARLPPKKDAQR